MDPANEVADRDVPISESAEHSTSTLPPLPTTSSERKNRSIVWVHFKRTPDDESKAQCQHCLKVIKCGNGTSAMRSHLKICISNPGSDRGKRQKTGTSPSPEAQMFYDATLRISGSFYVTSNLYMKEVFALGRRIQQYRDDDDLSISLMASKMKAKYNKYWGNAKTINMLLLIAVVLDPCHKLDYVEWCLVNSFGVEVDGELKTKLSSCLHSLYNLYQGADEGNQDDTLSQPSANFEAQLIAVAMSILDGDIGINNYSSWNVIFVNKMKVLVAVALKCVEEDKDARPTMSQVVEMLQSHDTDP
ncbi:hypothetical protein Ahy_A10g048547 [Arachis hypogaea]|uniref:BED-type domain-containing protein n=1 Tax=Arachis hypogaea TaxID=3818 RepID=A0A445B5B9_ARAHY|nr:hypothetical protein Ahy_A10g048547 [Arachis hypogaea]